MLWSPLFSWCVNDFMRLVNIGVEKLMIDSIIVTEDALKAFDQILLVIFSEPSHNILGNVLEKIYVIIFEIGVS